MVNVIITLGKLGKLGSGAWFPYDISPIHVVGDVVNEDIS